MTSQEITQYLQQSEGLPITNAKELIAALFDGEIRIHEQIPYFEFEGIEEYDVLHQEIDDALAIYYSRKKVNEILDRLNELRGMQTELGYRHCFEQGIRIGFALHELLKNDEISSE